MASKQVIDRQKSAEAVAAVGEAQAEDIGKGLRALFQAHLLPGETMPDTVLITRLLARVLIHRKDALIAADRANEAELAQDAEARAARDGKSTALYQRMTSLRPALSGLYGGDVTASIMPGSTPQDPVALSRYAVEVSSALRSADFPEPLLPGACLPVHAIAGEIDALRADLDQRLTLVAREKRETELTRDAKHRNLGEYDELFTGVANALAGLLLVNGKKALADKVKPSRSRPGRTEESVEPGAPAQAEPAQPAA